MVERVTLEELKKGDKVNVALKNMCIFLLSDGQLLFIPWGDWLDHNA